MRLFLATLVILTLQPLVNAQVEVIYDFEDDNNYVYDILNANGEYAYFNKLNQSTGNIELWITDGTEKGTKAIATDLSVASNGKYDVGYLNNRFYFFASEPVENSSDRIINLYVHDEVNGSIELIKQGNDDSNTHFIYSFENAVYISLRSEDANPELWRVNQSGLSKISIPACGGNSLTEDVIDFSRKPVEVYNSTNQVYELYFVNYCGDLIRYVEGSLVNLFESFGFRTNNSNPFDVYSDMYTVYNRRLIFYGQNLLNGSSNSLEGVHSINLDTGEYQLLVENTNQLRAQEYPARQNDRKTFIQTENGVYFVALDNIALSTTSSGQKENNNIWFSDGTTAGTQKIAFIEDDEPRSSVDGILEINLQSIEGTQLIYETSKYDDDPFNDELFAVNVNTAEITKLWDARDFTGFPYGHLLNGVGYVFADYVRDSSRTILISSNGIESELKSRTTVGESYDLEPGFNGYAAVIKDSVYIFKGKVAGASNTSLLKYIYRGGATNPDGNGGGSDDNETSKLTLIYQERFSRTLVKNIPINWENSSPNGEADTWFLSEVSKEFDDQTWFDQAGLSVQNVQSESYSESVESPGIKLGEANNVYIEIDYLYVPNALELEGATITLEYRLDTNDWMQIQTFQGSESQENISDKITQLISTNSSVDDVLQFRFRADFDGNGLAIGVPIFKIDDISVFGEVETDDATNRVFNEEDIIVDSFDDTTSFKWELIQTSLSDETLEQFPDGTLSYRNFSPEEISFFGEDILPGISLDGFLTINPNLRQDVFTGDPINYDEIIASEFIDIAPSANLRAALNVIYTPFIYDNDQVELNILGRPDTTSEWQNLYTLQTNPDQIDNLESLNLKEIDFALSDIYNDQKMQVGIQFKVNNYEYIGANGYYIDSLRIYSRTEIENQSPIVIQSIDSLQLEPDFGEITVADLNQVFEDPEGGTLSFDLTEIPSFLNANIVDAVLKITSNSGASGEGELRISATDNKGAMIEYSLHISVGVNTSLDILNDIPSNFELLQNYPNPFNPSSNIRFGLPKSGEVRLDVYNMLGQRVATLVDQTMQAGWHTVTFDASGLSSGTYIYRIVAGDFVQTRKMMLIK